MAKYSRSALSMKESLKEISEQKAEQFLNTFYFQYGHRSIADLAHIAFAIEKLSILAAIVLVDQQRWDGQERSTRYQNFKKSGYFIPEFDESGQTQPLYSHGPFPLSPNTKCSRRRCWSTTPNSTRPAALRKKTTRTPPRGL